MPIVTLLLQTVNVYMGIPLKFRGRLSSRFYRDDQFHKI